MGPRLRDLILWRIPPFLAEPVWVLRTEGVLDSEKVHSREKTKLESLHHKFLEKLVNSVDSQLLM